MYEQNSWLYKVSLEANTPKAYTNFILYNLVLIFVFRESCTWFDIVGTLFVSSLFDFVFPPNRSLSSLVGCTRFR